MKKQLVDRQLLNEQIWSNTYTALKCLIDNSYYTQISLPSPCYTKEDNAGYLKEFCTVRMCTARRSGHTMAIFKIAREYFEKFIFLSPTLEMSARLNECFLGCLRKIDGLDIMKANEHEILMKKDRYLFGTYNSLDMFRGQECEAVFVDGTFGMTLSKENNIYTVLAPCMQNYPQRFFVFVQ